MGPHFDSYANSGIPEIIGKAHQPPSGGGTGQRPDLLHLLPHLSPNDVGLNALSRTGDLQQLATAIQASTILEQTPSAQTCISGCTLLALAPSSKLQPPSRILMRDIRPGTRLLNANGKEVKVTNVYFSRENAVMVQISKYCHTTITHPLVDIYRPKQRSRYRKNPTKTVVAAAEWHTRRLNHTYRTTPRGNLPSFVAPSLVSPSLVALSLVAPSLVAPSLVAPSLVAPSLVALNHFCQFDPRQSCRPIMPSSLAERQS